MSLELTNSYKSYKIGGVVELFDAIGTRSDKLYVCVLYINRILLSWSNHYHLCKRPKMAIWMQEVWNEGEQNPHTHTLIHRQIHKDDDVGKEPHGVDDWVNI